MKITEIVFLNDVIVKHRESGVSMKMLQVSWFELEILCICSKIEAMTLVKVMTFVKKIIQIGSVEVT